MSDNASARWARLRRRRKRKPDAEIVLLCNPRAGGRWKALAGILDSEEAKHVRRIVTDSVEDVATAVAGFGSEVKLLCIYGGDGTIQRVLDRLAQGGNDELRLALLGGGTMNVTSRWCGFSRNPAESFRHVVRGFRSGELMFKDVPLIEVSAGDDVHRGFTFGMGPPVRLLDAYEQGRKGKVAAIGTAVRAIAATWTRWPGDYQELLEPMEATIELDGEVIPYDSYAALFANVTGQINPGVEPFAAERTRDTFYCAASAVSVKELSLVLPFLIRGWLPLDLGQLFEPGRFFERLRDPKLLADPRYVNKVGSHLTVTSDEAMYTVDGEILTTEEREVHVDIGPLIQLAAGPSTGEKMAAGISRLVDR